MLPLYGALRRSKPAAALRLFHVKHLRSGQFHSESVRRTPGHHLPKTKAPPRRSGQLFHVKYFRPWPSLRRTLQIVGSYGLERYSLIPSGLMVDRGPRRTARLQVNQQRGNVAISHAPHALRSAERGGFRTLQSLRALG